MFHLRTAQMHINAAISDRTVKNGCCPKVVKGFACLREAYSKIEEARELFAEADMPARANRTAPSLRKS